MKVEISENIKSLIKEKSTIKVLSTIDKNGLPHVVFKGSIDVDEDGNLVLLELLESSQTNKNLTNSIWFQKHVAITVLGSDKRSFQVKGIPSRVHITGPYFEKKYREVRELNPEFDLAGIWIIEPDEVREESIEPRLRNEKEKWPILGHADRDLKEDILK